MSIESALYQWEEGQRRIREADPVTARRLDRAADVVAGELRRRLGGSFTLDELVALYGEGTDWATDIANSAGGGYDSTTAVDAAFNRYSRGAADYAGGRRSFERR